MQLDSSEIELKKTATKRISEAKESIENSLRRIDDHKRWIREEKEAIKINKEVLYWIDKKEKI